MFGASLPASQNLAIDLGNNNTLLSNPSSLLLSQPSCMVLNTLNDSVEAVGSRAYEMMEKTHSYFKSVKPLKGGVISDSESAGRLLKALVARVVKPSFFQRPMHYLVSGIPYDTTNVEKRALRTILDQFSSRNTHLIHEPIAAAIGMGLNIREPGGKLVVDIGGGITEVVVISLSGIAAFRSVKVAGDTMDVDIQDYCRLQYKMDIGLKTAEMIKHEVGCVYMPASDPKAAVSAMGKDRREGIPVQRIISQNEITGVLEKSFQKIEECIHQTLQSCPPELFADIVQKGISVTGGNAQLKGIRERLTKVFGLSVVIDPHALLSVSKGIQAAIAAPEKFKQVLF